MDMLHAAGRELGFEEPELEEAFTRHAKADAFGVAFPIYAVDELPAVTLQRELEREFVQVAERRWAECVARHPQLERLAIEWARAFERGGELSPLQVRKALGIKNSYEEKLERRRERLEAAGERARERSDAAYEASRKAVEHIPLGQPIIRGHSSERMHRSALKKSHRAMDRSVDELRHAEELERRAEAVGRGGVSSDDPEAVDKLRGKLHELEQERERMKRVNAEFRKGGWDAVQGLSDEAKERCKGAMARAPWVRAPFESYALSNIGANIRRIKERINELESSRTEPASESVEGRGYRLEEDTRENRVRFVFDGKPPENTRALLKRSGFLWSPSAGAWQRQLNAAGRAAAERVRAALETPPEALS